MFFKINHTEHSKERWQQRFGSLCIFDEWSSALRATKSQRKIINNRNPYISNSEYYVSKNDIVFVCVPVQQRNLTYTLITVFTIDKNPYSKTNTNKKYRNYKHRKREANSQ